MGPPTEEITSSPTCPTRTDVVVIGGGIIGVSTALSLAERGISTVLLEKGTIAGEQSSRNWGWVRRMGRDPRELPLIVEALNIWDTLHQRLGEDIGFRRSGILYLCETQAEIESRQNWLRLAGDYAFDTRIIEGEELRRRLPGATRSYKAALYTQSDGRAEPQKASPAIARAAQRTGATVLTNCAVLGIERSAGRVSGVVTERGRIDCQSVVVAGGAWSSRLCRPLGIRLPQLVVRSSVLRTAPVSGGPEEAAWAPGFAYRKRADGGYTVANGTANRHDIGLDSFRYLPDFLPLLRMESAHVSLRLSTSFVSPFGGAAPEQAGPKSAYQRIRTIDPDPVPSHLADARRALEEVFPVFHGVPTVQSWAGLIDAMPDTVPVISGVDAVPGLVIATGFSGHGFGIGPAAGQLAADLASANDPVVDPSPFRFSRFSDGSKPRPLTGM